MDLFQVHELHVWICFKCMSCMHGSVSSAWVACMNLFQVHELHVWICFKCMSCMDGSVSSAWGAWGKILHWTLGFLQLCNSPLISKKSHFFVKIVQFSLPPPSPSETTNYGRKTVQQYIAYRWPMQGMTPSLCDIIVSAKSSTAETIAICSTTHSE